MHLIQLHSTVIMNLIWQSQECMEAFLELFMMHITKWYQKRKALTNDTSFINCFIIWIIGKLERYYVLLHRCTQRYQQTRFSIQSQTVRGNSCSKQQELKNYQFTVTVSAKLYAKAPKLLQHIHVGNNKVMNLDSFSGITLVQVTGLHL